MNIPPINNPRAYATPLLKTWQAELLCQRAQGQGRPNRVLTLITAELESRAAKQAKLLA